MTESKICTCPSGDGSLRHPCPAHPAVEQAGGDERDFQAKGAQEVPSPVSKEYDRHLIGLLRKGEALPGHQEEAADEIERLRDWNDHLNNTVLPNILNPNFLMLMKGGERLLDLCTKDGKFIGVSLNDMKDVFDWMVTHARIAPDHAALAQPSPASDLDPLNLAPHAEAFNEAPAEALKPEPAEADRPEVVAWQYRVTAGPQTGWSLWHPGKGEEFERSYTVERRPLMTVAQHERITAQLHDALDESDGDRWKLRSERDAANARLHEVATACATAEQERDAALAEVAGLRSLLNSLLCYVERDIDRMRSDRDKSDNKEIYDRSISLAMERLKAAQNAVFTTEPGCDTAVELAAQTTQAQHSVPVAREQLERLVRILDAHNYAKDAEALMALLAAAPGKEVPQAWLDVQAERRRQVEAEGWTPEHDDEHADGQMARAAACYALAGSSAPNDGTAALLVSLAWPWDEQWWKPSTARRDLVKACALALAEIERLDRACISQSPQPGATTASS